MKLNVKRLLFDFGGTIDTNGVHWGEVIRHAYIKSHIHIPHEQFRDAYVYVERLLGSQPLIFPDDTFRDVLRLKIKLQFEQLGLRDATLALKIAADCYDKAFEQTYRSSKILLALSRRYPLYLVSNFYGNLQTVLREFRINGLFREVIESANVGCRKPGLDIFRIAIEKTGCKPEEVVVIGDSYKNDIRPAIELGCPSIWLKVKSWHDDDESIEHPLIIKDISELLTIL